jgi:crotonobetainyl-CoA:carnitine CoA-transferase CaiB-like acyl-CoA transferase
VIYDGLRVVDASRGIAGGYCSKLLTDLGADVVKLEPPDGDPLRRYSATGSVGNDGDPDGVLFRYLHFAAQRDRRRRVPPAGVGRLRRRRDRELRTR